MNKKKSPNPKIFFFFFFFTDLVSLMMWVINMMVAWYRDVSWLELCCSWLIRQMNEGVFWMFFPASTNIKNKKMEETLKVDERDLDEKIKNQHHPKIPSFVEGGGGRSSTSLCTPQKISLYIYIIFTFLFIIFLLVIQFEVCFIY